MAWWPHTDDARVASYRLRCLQIVQALKSQGREAAIFRPGRMAPQVLVLSKRYDRSSLGVAMALSRDHGTSLVLDLCDNHFHFKSDPDGVLRRRAVQLREAVSSVDLVVAASEALADVVRSECPQVRALAVIPDAAELPSIGRSWWRWARPRGELALLRLGRALGPVPRPRRLVWFGHHGSPGVDAGMGDLARLRVQLEAVPAPVSLTVISNDREKFDELMRGWRLPCHYLEWDASTFSRALPLHSLALIPVTINPFTVCKTANRMLTAFLHGLNVVADSVPSYRAFSSAAVLDDWSSGLGDYLSDAPRRQNDVRNGQSIAARDFELAAIAERWWSTLQPLVPAR